MARLKSAVEIYRSQYELEALLIQGSRVLTAIAEAEKPKTDLMMEGKSKQVFTPN